MPRRTCHCLTERWIAGRNATDDDLQPALLFRLEWCSEKLPRRFPFRPLRMVTEFTRQ
jgi:hypothetical protein